MGRMQHIVQIAADNSDVFNGSIFEEVPAWARTARLQLSCSDSDWLWSGSIGGQEVARDSGPHHVAADNVGQGPNWERPFIEIPCTPGQDVDIDINVVTAGVGLMTLEFDDRS